MTELDTGRLIALTISDDSCHKLSHMKALKDREEAVRNGKLTTIIFVRDRNEKGHEVSASLIKGRNVMLDYGLTHAIGFLSDH